MSRRFAIVGALSPVGSALQEALAAAGIGAADVRLVEPGAEVAVIAAREGELSVTTPWLAEALDECGVVFTCVALAGADRAAVLAAATRGPILDLGGDLGGDCFDAFAGDAVVGPGVHSCPGAGSLLVAALARAATAAGSTRPPSAVIFEPAVEAGPEALEELHDQAVATLNFTPLPTAFHGRPVIHDVMSPAPLGPAGEARTRREVAGLLRGRPVALTSVHAGTFHGVAVSMHADVPAAAWRRALEADPALGHAAGATPRAAVAMSSALVARVEDDPAGGAWVFAAADTLARGRVGNAVRMALRT